MYSKIINALTLIPKTRHSGVILPEIQALRAAAVLMVVLFHLWPNLIPGGYAGVDVFFVISGFLITAHLLREIAQTQTINLASFWARRARRLLPAALLVLLTTTIAIYIWIPKTLWSQYLNEVLASTTYWQNWLLSINSIDYLASEDAATLTQHYWSLSVEEQFYIIWPLLLLASIAFAKIRSITIIEATGGALLIIFATSLTFSSYLTVISPSSAYFITPVRAWEFAVGGLLSLVTAKSTTDLTFIRNIIRWLGWAAIGTTAFCFTQDTLFPGHAALLPVFGSVAVIWASMLPSKSQLARIASIRPIQYIGDISYSFYLWHWPLIVIFPFIFEAPLGILNKSLLFLLSILLAGLTKYWIEDPIRTHQGLLLKTRLSLLLAAFGIILVVFIATIGILIAQQNLKASEARAAKLVSSGVKCFGADALLSESIPCINPELDGVLLPRPAARKKDTGGAYSCWDKNPSIKILTCVEGSKRPDAFRVALIGNSHAASLLPGLRNHLEPLNWSLHTYLARGCEWLTPSGPNDPCLDHRVKLQKHLEKVEPYDLIIVTVRRNQKIPSNRENTDVKRHADAWIPIIARGTPLVVLADNPAVPKTARTCITNADTLTEAKKCTMTPEVAWQFSDPLPAAVKLAGKNAHLIDLSAAYCTDKSCPLVIGNVIVYRDKHHITATFSKTLAPYLLKDILIWLDTR